MDFFIFLKFLLAVDHHLYIILHTGLPLIPAPAILKWWSCPIIIIIIEESQLIRANEVV